MTNLRTRTRVKLVATLAMAGLTLAACGSNDSGNNTSQSASDNDKATTITVQDNSGDVTVPHPPKAVASTDNRTFEVLEKWGVDLVAAPKRLVPNTIPGYKNNDKITDLGTHREPDLEALVASQPDLIIAGQRFTQHEDEIKKLNPDTPVIDFEPREGENMADELKRQVTELGKIFDKEEDAQKLVDDFDAALKRAKDAYDGKSTVEAVNVSGGEIGYIAPTVGRFYGPVFDWVGLKPALKIEGATNNHEGDDVSVETLAQANPDFIIVMDRDGAIKSKEDGYKPAEEILKGNEALKNVKAMKEGHVYVAPQDTYTNESIITYTEVLNALADQFEAAKK
ncbi:ABC transporter substrate-binding protein [Corynebacterium sp. 320]|uniref:ABC transporter substrate-binding protein n=1 Tax=Corynebacterium zhongnanshanii TaxID=2768834 RepID=A0ABQ6VE90_9CORY|nr:MULTISPECIES: ABC transporter substrate-binding protein [Corynebacterium]KAB1504397.1 ABC transporter substrate-binding protein [Corynebacterium sp. 320]KAB1552504.1 ABC transporter substrate-binding protein [Corynebacterium sp. 321]KAB1554281.1 ABC transporter substrate-binding protein [Corynebacterium sp. 319]KAB3522746.1 ABC transporter substrate-binding protein [Corynebacterium zhongnanshanii]KAB3528533.1 ABC transporter substrate-binding protein [Corynebacterium sp. 250]